MKALIIGLDGATWEVFDDYLLENHMPNLNRLKKSGYRGILRSTYPPITSAAWTTCITGCQPYKHGIVGFRNFFFAENSAPVSSAASRLVPTIFEQLSEQGYKVASINVPWTYPCRKINGVMVAGYGVPGTNVEFTYPPEFGKELLGKMPDYEVVADWHVEKHYDMELLERNFRSVEHRCCQRVEAAQMAYDRFKPDVMMVQFQNTDIVEHRVFDYVGRSTRDKFPQQRDRAFKMYEKLDECIGKILKMAGDNCNVIVVSDHGLCKTKAILHPNAMLYKWGYLKSKSRLGRMANKIQKKLEKLGIIKSSNSLEMRRSVDWKKSKAMVVYPAQIGYVYLNVKGRNKNGCISPGKEYDRTLKELKEKFSSVTDPFTNGPLFDFVGTPAELYGVDNLPQEIVGDLVIIPKDGFDVKYSASRKAQPVQILDDDSVLGNHCFEGIYILSGPGIRNSEGPQTHIVDIAPTSMAMVGAELPAYMDGKVIKDAFSQDLKIKYSQAKMPAIKIEDRRKLMEKEDTEITKRLAALGYMD